VWGLPATDNVAARGERKGFVCWSRYQSTVGLPGERWALWGAGTTNISRKNSERGNGGGTDREETYITNGEPNHRQPRRGTVFGSRKFVFLGGGERGLACRATTPVWDKLLPASVGKS